jgi:hypothetical protein
VFKLLVLLLLLLLTFMMVFFSMRDICALTCFYLVYQEQSGTAVRKCLNDTHKKETSTSLLKQSNRTSCPSPGS